MNLPAIIQLTRCATGEKENCRIETLTREVAKHQIDGIWWDNDIEFLEDPEQEVDRHWKWRNIISKYQNKPYFQAKCVRSLDSQIQAAILFRVDALSGIESGQSAVFVDRLSTAPRNREKLVANPVFRGAGTGLLIYSIALSYSLGFRGRVNLIAIDNEDFYLGKGFQVATTLNNEDKLYEISAEVAIDLLRKRDLIDG